jgi:tetratricopeptide (TPR) repeat protein
MDEIIKNNFESNLKSYQKQNKKQKKQRSKHYLNLKNVSKYQSSSLIPIQKFLSPNPSNMGRKEGFKLDLSWLNFDIKKIGTKLHGRVKAISGTSEGPIDENDRQVELNEISLLHEKYNALIENALEEAHDLFQREKYDICIIKLHKIIETALAAHDIPSLKRAHFLASTAFTLIGKFSMAIDHYKKLRNIGEATQDLKLNLHVYTELGLWYQNIKDYK